MSSPVALIDANVLYAAPLRDLLMQLALSRLFRPRWTARINDEWTRNLLANRPDITTDQVEFTKAMMIRAVPDSIVEGYEGLISILQLPDPNDRHVLAAAIKTEADVIITLNRKDFPREALYPHCIEVQHPDEFFSVLSELAPEGVIAAARECRARLVRPVISVEDYLTVLMRQGLLATAAFLQKNGRLI
jgi:predicted nucleic acid-binding protein